MEKLPTEIILKQILEMSFDDIINFCKTNKNINSICKRNKDYIIKKIAKRDYDVEIKKSSTFYFIKKLDPYEWNLNPQNIHTLGRWLDEKCFAGTFDLQRRAQEVPVQDYIALAQKLRAVA